MQSPEAIAQSSPSARNNTGSWQWQTSHFMSMEWGLMAFVPAGPVELDASDDPIKVLQLPDNPDIIGLACMGIVVPLDQPALEHLVEVAKQGKGSATVSIVSLPKEINMAIPLVALDVPLEELQMLSELIQKARSRGRLGTGFHQTE